MALPANTSLILQFLHQSEGPLEAWSVRQDGAGTITIDAWDAAAPQPTEQAIIDAGNDLTEINGQTFSQWEAEHGGDAAATAQRKVVETIDRPTQRLEVILRGLALLSMDEVNILRTWMRDFKAEVAAATSLGNLQARIAGLSTLNDRNKLQAMAGIKNKINSGNADTS